MAEFGQDFHATLVKAVSNNNTLHLCDLSASKVSGSAKDKSMVWLCFEDANKYALLLAGLQFLSRVLPMERSRFI